MQITVAPTNDELLWQLSWAGVVLSAAETCRDSLPASCERESGGIPPNQYIGYGSSETSWLEPFPPAKFRKGGKKALFEATDDQISECEHGSHRGTYLRGRALHCSLSLDKSTFAVLCCLACKAPRVRGIPKGSTPMPEEEVKDLLAKLQGQWKIRSVESMNPALQACQKVVSNDNYVTSGSSPNSPYVCAKETFHVYKGPNPEIYLDFVGSQLVKMDSDGGEVELHNGLGWKMLRQHDGKAPPQQGMVAA